MSVQQSRQSRPGSPSLVSMGCADTSCALNSFTAQRGSTFLFHLSKAVTYRWYEHNPHILATVNLLTSEKLTESNPWLLPAFVLPPQFCPYELF